jgi:UMP-CMP kinase
MFLLPLKNRVIFVLGGPGSGEFLQFYPSDLAGKTTQCRLLQNSWTHFSAGDLLRQEMASSSPESKLINDIIKEGHIVPSHITVRLLQRQIFSNSSKKVRMSQQTVTYISVHHRRIPSKRRK